MNSLTTSTASQALCVMCSQVAAEGDTLCPECIKAMETAPVAPVISLTDFRNSRNPSAPTAHQGDRP